MFVGSYWTERKESAEDAAERIVRFLSAIGRLSGNFSLWFDRARTKAAALQSPISLERAQVETRLRSNRRDTDGAAMRDLGYRLSLWNGGDVSFSVTIGAHNDRILNSVILDGLIGLDRSAYRDLMEAMIREFDPEHAVVTSDAYLAERSVGKPWEAGWLTYERGGSIQEGPLSMTLAE